MPSISADGFLAEIQQAAIDILDLDAAFDDVPMLPESLGDLDNAIQIVMNKLGIFVLVETPFASVTSPNTPPVHFNDVPILVTVWEDTVLNRFGGNVNQVHCMPLALKALWLLCHSVPKTPDTTDLDGNIVPGEAVATAFYPDNPTLVDLRDTVDRENYPNIQGVQIRLKCTTGYTYEPQDALTDGNNQQLLNGMGIKLTAPRPWTRPA